MTNLAFRFPPDLEVHLIISCELNKCMREYKWPSHMGAWGCGGCWGERYLATDTYSPSPSLGTAALSDSCQVSDTGIEPVKTACCNYNAHVHFKGESLHITPYWTIQAYIICFMLFPELKYLEYIEIICWQIRLNHRVRCDVLIDHQFDMST